MPKRVWMSNLNEAKAQAKQPNKSEAKLVDPQRTQSTTCAPLPCAESCLVSRFGHDAAVMQTHKHVCAHVPMCMYVQVHVRARECTNNIRVTCTFGCTCPRRSVLFARADGQHDGSLVLRLLTLSRVDTLPPDCERIEFGAA